MAISPRNGGIPVKLAISVRNRPISTSGFSSACKRRKSLRKSLSSNRMEVFDCSAELTREASLCVANSAGKAFEARASSRPPSGSTSPAEGDSRGCKRCPPADGVLGPSVRGGAAASPGCALSGAGAGTPAACLGLNCGSSIRRPGSRHCCRGFRGQCRSPTRQSLTRAAFVFPAISRSKP